MKLCASSLSSKDMRRHLREKSSLEAEVLRANFERNNASRSYACSPAPCVPRSRPAPSPVSSSTRRLLGKRPSFASLSSVASSKASVSPSSPQVSNPIIELPESQIAEVKSSQPEPPVNPACEDFRESVQKVEINPDFLGICLDGTARWATPAMRQEGTERLEVEEVEEGAEEYNAEESKRGITANRHFEEEQSEHQSVVVVQHTEEVQNHRSVEAIPDHLDSATTDQEPKTRPLSFKEKRPKINLVIPENQHRHRLSAVLKKSPSIDSIALASESGRVKGSFSTASTPLVSGTSPQVATARSYSSAPSSSISNHPKPPKSLRPFSRFAPRHIATMQSSLSAELSEMPPLHCNSSTASSEDMKDDDRSSCYSRKSSMSSLDNDIAAPSEDVRPLSTTGSVAFSIVTPGKAGVYDEPLPPPPKIPLHIVKKFGLIDLSNKPLPPEPKDLDSAPQPPPRMIKLEPEPLRVAGLPPSRTIASKQTSPTSSPLQKSAATMSQASYQNTSPQHQQRRHGGGRSHQNKGRSTSIVSLKSKYTTNDLDALDHAFQRAMPMKKKKHLTLEEAEMALEIHLSTIAEDRPHEQGTCRPDSPIINQPLQIARGPMNMAPSRAPPSPPLLTSDRYQKSTRSSRRLSLHVVNQIRSGSLSRRSSTTSSHLRHSSAPDATQVSWAIKAQKMIDRVASPVHSSKVSPLIQNYQALSQNSETVTLAEPCRSPVRRQPDPAILEIQKRLEILQMSQNSEAARIYDEQQAQKLVPHIHIGHEEHQIQQQQEQPNYATLYPPPPIPDETPPIPKRHSSRSSRPKSSATIRSLASLAVSDIPDLYANMPSSSETCEQIKAAREQLGERQISPAAAEAVLLHILRSLDNLQDLFSTAVVSKGFYRTFKRHELPLMKNALRKMSPAAWELREVTPPSSEKSPVSDDEPVPEYTPSSYLRLYTRDLYVMVALKSLMLVRCKSFLRSSTINALAGKDSRRSSELDDAFWRVWTFCKIFGSNKSREDEIEAQIDWLNGGKEARETKTACCWNRISDILPFGAAVGASESFGKGNCGGLGENELWDMTEIWICLGVLIRGFMMSEKRQFARDFGIFDNTNVEDGNLAAEEALIEEWTHHLLSLGPTVILDLATPSSLPGPEGFEIAADNGWTEWAAPPAGVTRTTFLKFAVTKAYQERVGSRPVSPSKHLLAVERKMKQAREMEQKVEFNRELTKLSVASEVVTERESASGSLEVEWDGKR